MQLRRVTADEQRFLDVYQRLLRTAQVGAIAIIVATALFELNRADYFLMALGIHAGAVAVNLRGDGIPEAIRHRIFDPFFTTKDVDRGSGQGLAISSAAMNRHGGSLTFDTTLGVGTTFYMRLPIATAQREAA